MFTGAAAVRPCTALFFRLGHEATTIVASSILGRVFPRLGIRVLSSGLLRRAIGTAWRVETATPAEVVARAAVFPRERAGRTHC